MLRLKYASKIIAIVLSAVSFIPAAELEYNSVSEKNGKSVERDIVHVVKIRNTSNDTFVISRTSSDCGCTSIAVEKNNIPPHSTSDVRITIDTLFKTHDFTNHAVLVIDGPKRQVLDITLVTHITFLFWIDGAVHNTIELQKGSVGAAKYNLKLNYSNFTNLRLLGVNSKEIKASLEPAENVSNYKLILYFSEPITVGKSSVLLQVKGTKSAVFPLPIIVK